jgi:transposase
VAKRRQLVAMRKAWSCQMQQARCATVLALDGNLMAVITGQIATLEVSMDHLIARDVGLATKRRLLESIPGIRPVASLTLFAEMPELGTLRPRAAAALTGAAPFCRDGGTLTGKPVIRGGRGAIGNVMSMCAISASRSPTSQKPFADRLKAARKPGKQILIAVARKLIEMANTVLQRGTPWVVTAE